MDRIKKRARKKAKRKQSVWFYGPRDSRSSYINDSHYMPAFVCDDLWQSVFSIKA